MKPVLAQNVVGKLFKVSVWHLLDQAQELPQWSLHRFHSDRRHHLHYPRGGREVPRQRHQLHYPRGGRKVPRRHTQLSCFAGCSHP